MSVYPTINGGVVAQRPYTSTAEFLHAVNEMDCGVRYAYSWRTNPLYRFEITYTAISLTEVATLETFFNSMRGRYGEFSFVDPATGDTHSHCRFDTDKFAVKYHGVNQCSVALSIVDFAS